MSKWSFAFKKIFVNGCEFVEDLRFHFKHDCYVTLMISPIRNMKRKKEKKMDALKRRFMLK